MESVDLLGYPIHVGLYESAKGHTLADELGTRPRPILFVQMKRGERQGSRYAAVAGRLGENGFTVDEVVLDGEESWWFAGVRWEADEDRTGTRELIRVTTDWVVRRVAEDPR